MKKKRSIGVTILGWYVIIFGLTKLVLVNAVKPSQDVIVASFLSLLLTVCGAGILRLINYARLCVITYFATSGLISIISYSYGLAETLINFKTPMKDPAGYTSFDAVVWIAVMIILSAVFYFTPALFLCASTVKEQFKKS